MSTPNQTWDQFEVGGNYVELALGVPVEGTILNIGAKRWDDGKVSPQITLDNPADPTDPRVLTAGWVMLVKKLKEVAPNVGDRIRVTWTSTGAKPKEMRDFSVEILPTGSTTAAPPVTPPTSSALAAIVAAEVPAGITPDQLAAMQAAMAPAAPAWDADPRVAALRGMGIADDAIRSTLGI